MAEAKTVFIPANSSDAESDAPYISDDADLQGGFEQLLRDSGDASADTILRVYQIPTNAQGETFANAKNIYLFSTPIDRMNFDEILDRVKRGFLRPHEDQITIRMLASRKGRGGLLFNRIATVRRDATDTPFTTGAGPAATMVPGGETAMLVASISKMMAEQQARTESMIAAVAGSRGTPIPGFSQGPDVAQLLTALGGIAVPIVTALLNRPSPQAQSMSDMMKMLTVARSLATGQPIEEKPEEDSLGGIVKAVISSVGPSLPAVIAALKQNPAAANAALPAPNAPPVTARVVRAAPPPAAPVAPPEVAPATVDPTQPTAAPAANPGESIVLLQLRKGLTDLVGLIEANKGDEKTESGSYVMDPAGVAGMIAESLPEELPPDAAAIIFADNAVDRLALVCPSVSGHREWFEAFIVALRGQYE